MSRIRVRSRGPTITVPAPLIDALRERRVTPIGATQVVTPVYRPLADGIERFRSWPGPRTLLALARAGGEIVERRQHLARLPHAVALEASELGQHAGLR